VELRSRKLVGSLAGDEIDAGGRADQERASTEHTEFLPVIQQQVGQVLVGVTGSGQCAEGQSTQGDLLVVDETAVTEAAVAGGRGQDGGSLGSELCRAGEEVGVQVGFGNQPDPQPPRVGCGAQPTQVA
jgi:hypothetical protein